MQQDNLASQVVALDARVLAPEEAAAAANMLAQDMTARLLAANQRETHAWERVRSKDDWQRFRDARIEALRNSLGSPPTTPLEVEVTGTIPGEGFAIEKLVIAGRPGLPITANLYRPEPPRESMPAILICSSHHNPKHQGELQDMGMTWARAGTLVLVPDNLGHGERRQQPFAGREDYHWRYNLGIQLPLIGESLIGWMVADLRRCLDVLLARPDVDAKRVVLMGAVAGGGDPAAVAVALDERATCSIPFNFGSTGLLQPKAPDTQPVYNFAGGGDWESTRCLRLSARDGFLPWVIVAAAAPRYLIWAKEFEFHADQDAAYQRAQKVYELYGAANRIAEIHGWGGVTLQPPAASHCNNVGPMHRKQIYPLLAKWLNMSVPEEYQKRLDPEALACLTPQAREKFRVRMVHEVAGQVAGERLAKARQTLGALDPPGRRERLRDGWARLLGDIEPKGAPAVKRSTPSRAGNVSVEKLLLAVEPGVDVPAVLLLPAGGQTQPAPPPRRPVVIGVAQQGKGEFLVRRAQEVAELLRRGLAVCLIDVRGTGETSPGPERTFTAEATDISSQEFKLGQTLVGSRLRDLRGVMRYLATRPDIDASRVGLWGESLAPVNPAAFVDPPLRTPHPPYHAEPTGALLAILGALYEDGVRAVVARGGLTGYAAVLDAPAFYVPHDAIVPGALEVGDVADLAAALAPLPLRLEGLVDGRNRAAGPDALDQAYGPARKAYGSHPDRLQLGAGVRPDVAEWMCGHLLGPAEPAAVR